MLTRPRLKKPLIISHSDAMCSGMTGDYRLLHVHHLRLVRIGSEHLATDTAPRQPSYCTLPMFHPVQSADEPIDGVGHVSYDGHQFSCENPAVVQQAFHVYVEQLRGKACAN